MVDISNYEKMQIKIFNAILDFGRPKTTYDLMQQHLKIATIHRHLKEMLDYGEIKVYEETKKGRKKINYGPTFIGITQFYNLDNKIRKNVEQIYVDWKDDEKFKEDLKENGFTQELLDDPNIGKSVFKDLIFYNAGLDQSFEKLANDPYSIPEVIRGFIGGLLLADKKEYEKARLNIISHLPTYQKIVEEFQKIVNNNYEKLESEVKKMKAD